MNPYQPVEQKKEVTYGQVLIGLVFLFLFFGLISACWIFRHLSPERQCACLRLVTNPCCYTVVWSLTLLGVRKLQARSIHRTTILASFPLCIAMLAMLTTCYPMLLTLGLGGVMAALANAMIGFFMENFFILQVPSFLWGRYLGIYLIFYHLMSLVCHISLGSGLISQRHALISSTAFFIFCTVFPDYFLWQVDTETSAEGSQKSGFFSRSTLLNRALAHPYAAQVVFAVCGLLLGGLTTFYPLLILMRKTEAVYHARLIGFILALVLGGACGQGVVSYLRNQMNRSGIELLRINLICFFVGILGLHQFYHVLIPWYACAFIVGAACHSLYPALIDVVEGCMRAETGWKPLMQKMDKSVTLANCLCSTASVLQLCCADSHSLVLYFMHTYSFLCVLTLFQSEMAEQYVKTKHERVIHWIQDKKEQVKAHCKKVVELKN